VTHSPEFPAVTLRSLSLPPSPRIPYPSSFCKHTLSQAEVRICVTGGCRATVTARGLYATPLPDTMRRAQERPRSRLGTLRSRNSVESALCGACTSRQSKPLIPSAFRANTQGTARRGTDAFLARGEAGRKHRPQEGDSGRRSPRGLPVFAIRFPVSPFGSWKQLLLLGPSG
jgi:hypothetical protein